jgi:hypothetical protein
VKYRVNPGETDRYEVKVYTYEFNEYLEGYSIGIMGSYVLLSDIK